MSEGPSLRFPFEWPDAHAPTLHWRRQTANGPLRPLQEDVALALRGLEDQEEHDVQEPSPKEGHGPHWRDLVTARAAVHEWRKQLEAPETLGGPPPPGVQDRPGMEPPP